MAAPLTAIVAASKPLNDQQLEFSIRRILHPTDLSSASEPALVLALDLAKQNQAELLLVHVLPPPTPLFEVESPTRPRAESELLSIAQRAKEANVIAKRLLLKGRAHVDGQIIRCAELTGADLIVMGTHGRTGILRMLLGSVASRVIARARCPVLVVRGRD